MVKFRIIAFVGIAISLLLQHVLHEVGHMLGAIMVGVKIDRVHWFTYTKLGGTRVFYKNEPDPNTSHVERKWGWIAASGLLFTVMIGSITMPIGRRLGSVWMLVMFIFSSIMLLSDPFYFLMGSIMGFGDAIGVSKGCRLSRVQTGIIALMLMLLDGLLIAIVYYK